MIVERIMQNKENMTYRLVSCPICKSDNYSFFMKAKDLITGLKGEWTYVKCCSCEFVYENPQISKSDLMRLYSGDNIILPYHILNLELVNHNKLFDMMKKYAYSLFNYGTFNKKIRKFIPDIVELFLKRKLFVTMLPPFKENGQLLEIGFGNGDQLVKLNNLGWQVEGIEPNKKIIELYRKEGFNVRSGDIDSIQLENDRYDVVLMSMVLEHCFYPAESIKKIFNSLKDHGLFIFSIPVIDGIEARLFKEYAYTIQPPFHLSQFTRKSIRDLLKKQGFRKIMIFSQWFDRDIVASAGFYAEEKNMNWLKKIVEWKPFRFLLIKPVVYILSLLGLTSRIVVYAKK